MVALVDQYGRPLQTDELDVEIAGPTLAGIRSPWFTTVATGLTPAKLAAVIRQVDEGDAIEYLTLAEEMEERDPHYYSALSSRKRAVSSLNIFIEAANNSAQAEKHADFVRDVLTSDEASTLTEDLLDALGKGYSVTEILWDKSAKEYWPKEFKWVDPRYFRFDWQTGQELRLLDESDAANGLRLPPYKFIQHRPRLKTGMPIRGGLARLTVIAFMAKGYTLKDWLAFAEVFGMPLRLGKYGVGARPEEKAALLRAVSQIGTDAAAIIPDSMMIDFVDGGSASGGDKIFLHLAEYLDRQVSKAVVGQTASSEGTPGALGAQDAQENVRKDIWMSDAFQLSATLKRDLVKVLVDLNFGSQPRGQYPKVRIGAEDSEDLEKFAKSVAPMIDRGLPVEASVVLDKFGLPMPDGVDKNLRLVPEIKGNATNPSAPAAPAPKPVAAPGLKPVAPAGPPPTTPAQLRALPVADLMALAALGLASAENDTRLPLDKLVDEEMAGWKQIVDPLITPVIALANRAKTKDEFLAGLKKLSVKRDTTAGRIAIATFKARIQGQVGE